MINILRVTNLIPSLMSALQSSYLVHDRDHITDPGALQRIRAMVGGGDAVIDKKLMSDRKSTRLNSSHVSESRMPSSA